MIFKEIYDGYLDEEKGIIWQKEQCEDRISFYNAIEYCESLGDGWRLPTIKELTSIVNYEKSELATDLPDMLSSGYWSATDYANNTDNAWHVYFHNGNAYSNNKSDTCYVRAVKDYSDSIVKKKDDIVDLDLGNMIKYICNCDEKKNTIEELEKARMYLDREIEIRKKKIRFKEVNDGYLDCENSIIWQKEQCNEQFSFYDAIEYCKYLGNGWRLPTIQEMTSITNRGICSQTTDLPNIFMSYYWSSTTYENNKCDAWKICFNSRKAYPMHKSVTYYVRAVKDFNSKVLEKKEIY